MKEALDEESNIKINVVEPTIVPPDKISGVQISQYTQAVPNRRLTVPNLHSK